MKKTNYFSKLMLALTLSATMSLSMASYISLSKQSPGYSQVKAKTKGKAKSKKMGLSTKTLTLSIGKTYTLKFNGSKKVKWQSKNKKIATVNNKGKVKAKKVGKTKIICTAGKKTYVCSLKVVKPKIQLNYKKLIIKEKGKMKLKLLNAKGKVTWKSLNNKIATVSKTGTVYGKKAGKTTVQASHKKKVYKCNVTVVEIKNTTEASSSSNSNESNTSAQTNNTVTNNGNTANGTNDPNKGSSTNANNTNDSKKPDQGSNSNTGNSTSGDKKNDSSANTENDHTSNTDEPNNNNQENNKPDSNVAVKEEVKVISDDSKEEKSTMKEIHSDIADFYSSKDASGNELMNFVVSNDNPLYQYVMNGLYKTGDIIYIEPNKYFVAGLSVKYIGHDDQYQEGMYYNVDSYEVIHTQKASLSDMYDGDLNIKSDSFDQENPIAFNWTPTIKDQTASTAIKKAKRYGKLLKNANDTSSQQDTHENSNDDGSNARVFPNLDEAISFKPENFGDFYANKEIKYGFNDLIMYDGDGDLSTTNDQIILNGSKEFKNINPELNIDWKLKGLPNALTAKLTYEENTNVKMNYSPKTGGLDKVVKKMNQKVLGDSVDNKINLKLFGFVDQEISGIDLSDRVILAAVGLNTAVGKVSAGYKNIVGESKVIGFSPILMLLVTLDLDGNINFECTANYDKSEYIEKGVNIYNNKGSDQINHATEGTVHEIGKEKISFINVDAKSKEELDKDPVSTLTLQGEGSVDYKVSLNGSCAVMLSTVIPAYINAEAGIKGEGYVGGKLEKKSDSDWNFDGGISMKNQVFANITGLVKIKFEGDLIDKSIEKTFDILSKVFIEFNKSTFNFKGIYYVMDNHKKAGIEGASVELKSSKNGTAYQAKTDENGKFSIPNILIDEYEINITKDSYTPISKTMKLDVNNLEFDGKTTRQLNNVYDNDFYNYYYYGDGYHISLNSEFKEELNKASNGVYTGKDPEGNEITWKTGDPLPNPTGIYKGHILTDMSRMFTVCYSRTLDLSNFNTSNITNMADMFYWCRNLETLDLSNFDTSNVKDLSGMFWACPALKSLDLSNFDTSNVENMRHMFEDCSSLKTLDLSNFNTSNVESMSAMFSDCTNLESIDLSSFNKSNVKDMSSMFFGCKNLESIDLSSFDTSNVKYMGEMFYWCYSLKTLDLSNFNTSNVEYMRAMFWECKNLESIDLSSFNTSNVKDMGYMFYECYNLKSLDLSSFDTSNVENMYEMFGKCNSLKTLDLSSFDTSNVKYMGQMFYDCSSLKTLDLSNFNTSNVGSMYKMFLGCTNLESIDLNSFDTSNVENMGYMFNNCKNLKSLDLSTFNLSNDEIMSLMFYKTCQNSNTTVTGYAKDSATADQFNDYRKTDIETSKLKFVAKQ